MLSIIAVIGQNRELGTDNKLLWHLPDDLKRFKELTTGHAIIMGRKTFEAIGRALPNRKNIVISRQSGYLAEGCQTVTSFAQALEAAGNDSEIFVIGGGEIYALALPLVKRLYLTCVDATATADTFFPDFSENEWQEVFTDHHAIDDKHSHSFTYRILDRR